MEHKEYYILINNEKQGPYTLETLKHVGFNTKSKIWHNGLADWTRASELPELLDALHTLPPQVNTNSKKRIAIITAVAVIIAAMGLLFLNKSERKADNSLTIKTNEELYRLYAPAVVLIKNKYIFKATLGNKVFFYNYFSKVSNNYSYVSGLTNDSLQAVENAEAIEGTGFFISKDGKLLTNRHVAEALPTTMEQDDIKNYIIETLNGTVQSLAYKDSITTVKLYNDSLLTELLKDTIANAAKIVDAREKVLEMEEMIAEEENYKANIDADSTILEYVKAQTINIEKITLLLNIYPQGTATVSETNGITCKEVAVSETQSVDLAILQTTAKALPDAGVTPINLTRIYNSNKDKYVPQISERLILIGYNEGTFLATTSQGIQAQLTDGKVSQNTDLFKLLYTIPTLPGSSGSPVIDDKGRLVSVNFAGITQTQSFNYGVQTVQIKHFLEVNNIEM